MVISKILLCDTEMDLNFGVGSGQTLCRISNSAFSEIIRNFLRAVNFFPGAKKEEYTKCHSSQYTVHCTMSYTNEY